MPRTIRIPGPNSIRLVLDATNAHTPAMVYGRTGGREYSATYSCAMDNGIEEMIELTRAQAEMLATYEDEVDALTTKARAGHPDYA